MNVSPGSTKELSMNTPFDQRDIKQIESRGMTTSQVVSQLEMFRRGFVPLHLERPCTVGDGIVVLDQGGVDELIGIYERAASVGRSMKFVPASGAASRMFRSLAAISTRLDAIDEKHPKAPLAGDDLDRNEFFRFIKSIHSFAFYNELKIALAADGHDADRLLSQGRYKPILEYLLSSKGLGYAQLPKGLIKFHTYDDHPRTALEEQLVEAVAYVRDQNGVVRIHFTVAPAYKADFEERIRAIRAQYEKGVITFSISLSVQEPSSDTIAVDPENRPFRDREGRLVFRPGGHGALLANLNDLKGDIVFIKNIDNVAVERLQKSNDQFKKALGGYLVRLQNAIFRYLRKLTGRNRSEDLIGEAAEFIQEELFLEPPSERHGLSDRVKIDGLKSLLNRPLRICGMVPNAGEPGGGPFWVRGPDGRVSPQIVESTQVDWESRQQRAVWESSTHFNPVDIVCGVRDYLGRPFDLNTFVDPNTGFVSTKSQDGRELQALELPGLWNGAMARWNTVFVEVPLTTFSPVKTVLDLLREEHLSR